MRKKKVVIDTSCLIALDNIGVMGILCRLYKEVIITEAVLKEFGEINLKCVKIEKIKKPLMKFFEHRLNLGRGESEVITFAFQNKYCAIIDDMKARNVAKELGVKITGTIGLLLSAEKLGVIDSAYKKAVELRKKGFYLPDKLLRGIKKR